MDQLLEWLNRLKNMDMDQIQQTLESYSDYGPLPGILLPLIEAFLPVLPLILFVAVNANVYGLWLGFLYSWIGVCAGSMLVFWISRKVGGRFGSWLQRRFPGTSRFFHWIEQKGFTPIFLLACFPFSPSALINISAGLSTVPFHTFLTAILLGKAVMIFTISLVSFDISQMVHEPWRPIVAVIVLVVMWLGGKKLEARYH